YIAGNAAGAALAGCKECRAAYRQRVRGYTVLIVACLAATLINPYFTGLHHHIASYLFSGASVTGQVSEWLSPDFHNPRLAWFEVMLALGAAAGLWHGLQMREIFSICDRITVLRDGMTAGTRVTSEATTNEIITMMVGRELKDATSRPVHSISDEALLTVAGLTTDKIRAMTFELRRGE